MNLRRRHFTLDRMLPILCVILLTLFSLSGCGGSSGKETGETAGREVQQTVQEDAEGEKESLPETGDASDPAAEDPAQEDAEDGGGSPPENVETDDAEASQDISGEALQNIPDEETQDISDTDAQEIPDEHGSYTTMEDVALYLHVYGHLPENFITKKEARALGWSGGSVEKYAPGMCIGGDHFGNYEGILPDGDYHECDINTLGRKGRGAERLIYADDGRIYYTNDHYETFTLLYE